MILTKSSLMNITPLIYLEILQSPGINRAAMHAEYYKYINQCLPQTALWSILILSFDESQSRDTQYVLHNKNLHQIIS